MANTNFAALTNEEKTIWARDVWTMARNSSFINQFAGRGANSMVQRVTELRKSEKGARAVITLVHDMIGDGITGDYTLEGREEALAQDDVVIRIDQLRNAVRHEGRLADQKSVVMFREQARDKLAYWLADRIDQLAFLTMAGIAYTYHNNGKTRPVKTVGGNLSDLEFAADVAAPTSERQYRWDASSGWVKGADTANLAAADTLTYKALVQMKAIAKEHYIRGLRTGRNEEVFHVFLSPTAMSQLKLDSDYLANVRNAGMRGGNNELFAGTTSVMVDGLVIHEHRHVFNTSAAASGSKWGSGGTVNGCAALFCGAQALGMADIGNPYWVEKDHDYDNQPGISVGKMFGFLKPKFTSIYEGDTTVDQDFGVIRMDVAQ